MDITFIRTFLELSQTRHFGKTAQMLFITQSAVSARIRHLEEQLGVKLLTRSRNNIQLTPAGLRFQKHAESIVSLWNLARQETALADENMTLLSIGGVFSLWDSVLGGWMSDIRHSCPDIALQAEALGTEVMLGRIREGALDLGFLFDAPRLTNYIACECGNLELVLVSSTSGLGTQDAMNKQDYILVDWGTEFATTHANLFPDCPPPHLRVNLGRLAMDQLINKGGSAYLARDMVEPWLKSGTLFYVADAPVIERQFYAIYAATGNRKELVESVLNIIANKCGIKSTVNALQE